MSFYNHRNENEENEDSLNNTKPPLEANFFTDIANSFFELFRIVYFIKTPKENTSIYEKLKVVIVNLVFCAQLTSLLWMPDLSIYNWKGHMKIWKYIGYLRLDTSCAALDIMDACTYISIVIILANILVAIMLIILIYFCIRVPKIILRAFKISIYLWSNLFLIPTIIILTFALKYKLTNEDFISEYNSKVSLKDIEHHVVAAVLAVPLIILSFFFIICTSIFSGDIRHSVASKVLESRSHSKIEYITIIYTFVMSILYGTFAFKHTTYFQVVSLIYSSYMIVQVIRYLPYFSPFSNCVASTKFWIIFLVSFMFLFGRIIDSAMAIVLLSVIIVPLSSVFIIHETWDLYEKRRRKVSMSLQSLETAYQLEMILRATLIKQDIEDKEKIIKIFAKCYLGTKLYKNKLLAIWETNYCIFNLVDESLAKVKLGKGKESNINLESSYQSYLCQKSLEDHGLTDNAQFLHYLYKIQKAKKEDEYMCMALKEFWRELVSLDPDLKKLDSMLHMISNNLEFLHSEYFYLITNFPRSKEALVLYSTFLQNILFETERSSFLNNKRASLEKVLTSSVKDHKKLSFFDENNGVILVSWDKQTLGKIHYANSRAAAILKQSVDNLIGSDISSYIPEPFDKDFNKQMYDFLHMSNRSEIELPTSIYIKMPNNYIVECNARVSITSISHSLTLVCIFRERPTTHQIALINSSGEIYAYSMQFTKFTGRKIAELKGMKLTNLFPDLRRIILLPFVPYKLTNQGQDTYLISCYRIIGSTHLSYVLLINDPIEIQSWKHGEVEEIQESRKIKRMDLDSPLPLRVNISFTSDETIEALRSRSIQESKIRRYTSIKAQEDVSQASIGDTIEISENSTDKWEDEKSIVHSLSSASFSHERILKRIMDKIAKSVKIFNWTLIISMTAVLVTNLVVLIYTAAEVNSASDLSIPLTLGKLGKTFLFIDYFARSLQVSYGLFPEDLINRFTSEFVLQLDVLKDMHLKLSSNLANWRSCNSQEIFIGSLLDVWSTDDGIYLQKMNLMNTLEEFINHGNEFIANFKSSQSIDESGKFFYLNGFGNAFHYCNSSLYELIDCEVSNINDLAAKIYLLSGLGFGVLCVCTVAMLPFYFSIDKMKNIFWNYIKQKAYEFYFDLRQACSDRLASIHGQIESIYSNSATSSMSKEAKFKKRWKSSWKVLIYFAISFFFFLFNLLYLYENCTELLSLRPKLIRELINMQLLHKGLAAWSSEISAGLINRSLVMYFPSNYAFKNANINFKQIMSQINYSKKQLRDHDYVKLLTSDYISNFYEEINSSNNVLSYGAYSAGDMMAFDAYYLSYSIDIGVLDLLSIWFQFVFTSIDLSNEYETLISLADDESQAQIQTQLGYIIITLAIYAVVTIILYFGFYIPFLRWERKRLVKMQNISNIIPIKALRSPDSSKRSSFLRI
ncbi:unnamed protein product [Blepharisma stoltei]|uniref:PAS domain-containing protein n=1 Tax=Blepharisma stoltei TaxID=1481888 RepID=A0AAU9KDF4_9CILI|nr:unnamed protein product [Blepharisma stoltei]